MRGKVLPKRGLRLWEPVLWGIGLAIPVHQYALFGTGQFKPSPLFLLVAIVALGLFPIADALSHREHGRMVQRSAVFALVFGLIWATLELLDRPVMTIRAYKGNGRVLLLFLLPLGCGLVSWFSTGIAGLLFDKVFGKQMQHPTGFCCACGYSLEGLDEISFCPECGRDRSIPPESVWKHPRSMRLAGLVLVTILGVWQLAHTTRLWVTETVPVLRFLETVDSDSPTSVTKYFPPWNGQGFNEVDHRAYAKSVDVTMHARELGLELTHITLRFVVWDEAREPTMKVSVGKVSVGSSYSDVRVRGSRFVGVEGGRSPHFITYLSTDEYKDYLQTGGLTDERKREFLRTYKERLESTGPVTISVPE